MRVTGGQIAFLMFAVLLLSVPAGRLLTAGTGWAPDTKTLVERLIPFAVFAVLLLSVGSLRRASTRMLGPAIPRNKRLEVAAIAIAMVGVAFATAGARVLWTWRKAGEAGLATMTADADGELAKAISGPGLVTAVLLGVFLAPLLEELLCRGFLYKAFERNWGWLPALFATSVVFAAYHPYFFNAFVMSILFVCIMQRTGSLRASIYVHAFSNLMMWWPLMGQHLFPPSHEPAPALSAWSLHLACLALSIVLIPVYVWMSRDRHTVAPTVMLEPNGAVPK